MDGEEERKDRQFWKDVERKREGKRWMGLGNGSWGLQEVGKCGQLDGQFAREA